MNELLKNYMQSPNPHLIQASCFWLLMFVKKCSKISKMVEKNLPQIQQAFIQALGEKDEVTQEVASKDKLSQFPQVLASFLNKQMMKKKVIVR